MLIQIKKTLLILMPCCLILFGCASSNITRDASANVDLGIQNARNLADRAINGNIADTYQNLNQKTKSAIIGGVAGAITGALTPVVGVLPGTAAGLILGASYGSYIDANASLEDRLENRGVNLIVLGDQILIIIPSARIFNAMTAHIKPDAYSTLSMVVEYINRYTKMLVKISTYTNATGSEEVDLALSNEQAQSLEKFLLATGLDTRLIYACGYGGTRLVSRNTLDWDSSDNYRVEITLEKLYV